MRCPICSEEVADVEEVQRWGPEWAHSRCVTAYNHGKSDAEQASLRPKPLMTDEQKAILLECRNQAMKWAFEGRIPECGAFGGIAQDLDWLCTELGATVANQETKRKMSMTKDVAKESSLPEAQTPDVVGVLAEALKTTRESALELMRQALTPAPAELKERCAEILHWKKTGLLEGNALRTYAEKKYPGVSMALPIAESDTASEAFEWIANLSGQAASPASASSKDVAREPLYRIVLKCPHRIEADSITLHYDPKQKGHNALAQLSDRLSPYEDAA